MATSPILELLGVDKTFGTRRVLTGVEARLGRGDRLGLSGPNGSGKTTLLRCIAGTVTPTRGTIEVTGYPAGSVGARAATGGAVSQDKAFYQRLSGLQNLLFYASLRSRSTRDARNTVEALVDELELGSLVGERVDRYSSGMLQQLGLARALIGGPALLMLDEPTRSLDTKAVERLWGAVDRRPEVALLIASHRQSDLERCSQRMDLS